MGWPGRSRNVEVRKQGGQFVAEGRVRAHEAEQHGDCGCRRDGGPEEPEEPNGKKEVIDPLVRHNPVPDFGFLDALALASLADSDGTNIAADLALHVVRLGLARGLLTFDWLSSSQVFDVVNRLVRVLHLSVAHDRLRLRTRLVPHPIAALDGSRLTKQEVFRRRVVWLERNERRMDDECRRRGDCRSWLGGERERYAGRERSVC